MRYWLTYTLFIFPFISFAQNKLITGSVVVDEGNDYISSVSGARKVRHIQALRAIILSKQMLAIQFCLKQIF